ncbi:hypothetical protein [Marinifilum flexuosum]|uniref:hypothetical protein n=1 Tax=Marinifilum flexuosum TaxID=1117708 RepID=UPI002493B7B7|nr:hypothetical protein [Marinifilum flexuosum]
MEIKKKEFWKLLSIITLACAIVSCSFVERKKGPEIPPQISKPIWKLTSDFYVSIIKGDFAKSKHFLNESVFCTSNNEELQPIFSKFQALLIRFEFNTQNSFYQKSFISNSVVSTNFNDPEISPFSIKYVANCNESAFTTAIIGQEAVQNCLTTIMGKYDNEWKIDAFLIGLLKVNDKDADDWLNEAEYWFEQGDYIMADYCLKLSNWLLKPANEFWKYENEKEILESSQILRRKINRKFKLPSSIEELSSKPKIVKIFPTISYNNVYPAITYVTKFPLNDSISLSNECSALEPTISNYFKNIESDSVIIKIIDKYDPWSESEKYKLAIRKIVK